MKTMLVTGGAGFIGGNFIRRCFETGCDFDITNVDKISYAAWPQGLEHLESTGHYKLYRYDIQSSVNCRALVAAVNPDVVVHFAAESHVDRSIDNPEIFTAVNVLGTHNMLEAVRRCCKWREKPNGFLFLHISTDEVYGSLGPNSRPSKEGDSYSPNSPYSASKAASDHMVRAYAQTYGLPVVITHCTNNYGPFQFPEKLIPLMVLNALEHKPLPIYGDGCNVRDWIHVMDHCDALLAIIAQRMIAGTGHQCEVYNIGSGVGGVANIAIVSKVCNILAQMIPYDYRSLMTFVKDRPGHDRRYALDTSRAREQLHWSPKFCIDTGLKDTIAWYLNNRDWVSTIHDRRRLG